MRKLLWSTLLFSLSLLLLAAPLVKADTSQITAVPDTLPVNGVTSLQISRLTAPLDTILSLTVKDPSGTIWTHGPSVGQTIPLLPASYDVNFGSSSTGWASNDGDTTQTDEAGTYEAEVRYTDGSRDNKTFSADAFFTVPEFALPLIIPVAAGFAGLTLIRRRARKA